MDIQDRQYIGILASVDETDEYEFTQKEMDLVTSGFYVWQVLSIY